MRMLPTKLLNLVGAWFLTSTTNPAVPLLSELCVDYTQVEFTTLHNAGFTRLQRRCYGCILEAETSASVVWLKLVDLKIDTGVLPTIQVPVVQQLYRMRIYNVSENKETAKFTVKVGNHSYTFQRMLVRPRPEDTLLKLFATQIVIDMIRDALPILA